MKITIYNYGGERNRLSKNADMTFVGDYDGTLKESESLMKGEIALRLENGAQLLGNYCYLDALERYYFIDDIEQRYNGLFNLKLSEDVLMSHLGDIRKMVVEIDESENPNPDCVSCETEAQKTLLRAIPLGNPFTDERKLYLLTVQGV